MKATAVAVVAAAARATAAATEAEAKALWQRGLCGWVGAAGGALELLQVV
jgi:hypothetical protein